MIIGWDEKIDTIFMTLMVNIQLEPAAYQLSLGQKQGSEGHIKPTWSDGSGHGLGRKNEMYNSPFMHLQFNSFSAFAKSLEWITFVMFLFWVIENGLAAIYGEKWPDLAFIYHLYLPCVNSAAYSSPCCKKGRPSPNAECMSLCPCEPTWMSPWDGGSSSL